MRSFLIVVSGLMLLGTQGPGAQTIAFNRVEVGQPEIFVAASDGSNEHPLLPNPDRDYDAIWSPDGKSIAFTSGRGKPMPFSEGRWERLQLADLYIVHPDGTGLKKVPENQ